MSKWIRENLVLVSGIVLPVLLVIGFFILNSIPRVLAEPPEYDFLLVAYHYDYQNPRDYYLSFEVRDGKLIGLAAPKESDERYSNRHQARIYRYLAASNQFEEIVFDLPDGVESLEQPAPIELNEAGRLSLDKRRESPDGYQFEFLGYRGRGGLLGELFGMHRDYRSNYVLQKGSGYIELPDLADDPYYNQNDVHFMGWIIEGEPKP
ncbi:MAG TPA: hypothetical protein VFG52_10535 [Xanthomonadales bacterium]|nr:hypothetical protein [Xanthomonadales bacterium]